MTEHRNLLPLENHFKCGFLAVKAWSRARFWEGECCRTTWYVNKSCPEYLIFSKKKVSSFRVILRSPGVCNTCFGAVRREHCPRRRWSRDVKNFQEKIEQQIEVVPVRRARRGFISKSARATLVAQKMEVARSCVWTLRCSLGGTPVCNVFFTFGLRKGA